MKEKKRIWLSLSRKKSNFLLFGILLVLMFFILVFLSVYNTAKETISHMERTYGTSFSIELCPDKNDPTMWEDREIEGLDSSIRAYIGPNIDEALVKRIAEETGGITDYETGSRTSIMLDNYELIPGYNTWSYEYFSTHEHHLQFGPEETKNMMYVTECWHIGNSNRLEQFHNGSFRLAEGRHLTREDRFKCIVSKAFAEKNNLKLGDTLKINYPSLNVRAKYPVESLGTVETEIVGLFEVTYQQAVNQYTSEEDILENWVITDNAAGEALGQIYGAPYYLAISQFFVENPKDIDKVMGEVKKLDWIEWKCYDLAKDDGIYKEAVKPLHIVKTIMLVCMGISLVSGVVLMFLVITHSMRKRIRETGILMSVGITGKEIKRQFFWEHLLIGSAAFLLALLVSFAVTPVIGQQIYGSVNKEKEQKVYTEKEIEAAIARGEQSKVTEMAKNQKTGIEPPKEIMVKMKAGTVFLVFASMLLIISYSVNAAIKKTLKLEPVRVLSMLE